MTTSTKTTSSFDFKQGQIWVAPIWSHTENKTVPRPVVIVGNDKANDKIGLVINFVTKQGSRNEFDVELKHWAQAGLKVKSWVRTAKPITILKSEIKRDLVMRDGVEKPRGYVGELHKDDLAMIIEMCKAVY